MSKLLTEPKTGYVKPKDGVSSGVYPKTLVDAVYNEEKGESLSETLKNLESQGGGGISGDMTYEEQQEARKNLGLYNTGEYASYGQGVQYKYLPDSGMTPDYSTGWYFGIGRKSLDGSYKEVDEWEDVLAALPTYEEAISDDWGIMIGNNYVSASNVEKKSERTFFFSDSNTNIVYAICRGSDGFDSGTSAGWYQFSNPGIYVLNYQHSENPEIAWWKAIKIPSEFIPEPDLSTIKIPGYLYITMPSGYMNKTRVGISEVANALQMTSDDLEALFGPGYRQPFHCLVVKSGSGNPTTYISNYELYKDRLTNTDATAYPYITASGTDRIFEVNQPDTYDYLHLKATRHSSTVYSVLVDAPD